MNLDEGVTDYADGVYRIWVNTSSTDVWANPGLNFTDAIIEVEATKVGGSDDNVEAMMRFLLNRYATGTGWAYPSIRRCVMSRLPGSASHASGIEKMLATSEGFGLSG